MSVESLAADLEQLQKVTETATVVLADPTSKGGATRRDKGATAPHQAATTWGIVLTPDYADVTTPGLERPIVSVTDWDGVMRHFGLDPAEFEVVDDTVRMSKWQQSKRLENGDRDLIWLHSYSARFRRVSGRLPQADIDALMARVRKWKPARRSPGAGLGAPATLHVGWSDWQLGKPGVAITERRVLDSFEKTIDRVKELRKIGRNVTSLAIVNMGDPIEGCYGNYDSQAFAVELTKRQQLNLALDLWAAGIRALAPLFDDVEFTSVLSNHSEWTRSTAAGSKPVTTDDDNADGFLAETLRRVLDGRPGFDHIRWNIPHDQFTMTSTLSGVDVAYTHGHKMPGTAKEEEWLKGQSIRLLRERGAEPRLWFTAHLHHLNVKDFGPWTRVQHPSLDLGSKWLTDLKGNWSTPGTLTCLVGEHDAAGGPLSGSGRGFSDLAVL